MRLLIDLKELIKKVLERNVMIILLSMGVFIFLFFTKNGIVYQYYVYNTKKNSLYKDIYQKKKSLLILNKKMDGLKNDNIDVMEEILYLYQNKDPYPNKIKTIITINNQHSIKKKIDNNLMK